MKAPKRIEDATSPAAWVTGWTSDGSGTGAPAFIAITDAQGFVRGLGTVSRKGLSAKVGGTRFGWSGYIAQFDRSARYVAYAILADGLSACPIESPRTRWRIASSRRETPESRAARSLIAQFDDQFIRKVSMDERAVDEAELQLEVRKSAARPAASSAERCSRKIGVDRILREPEGVLIVEAAVEMPDWRASRFRPSAVFFEGERFAVRSHRHERRGPHVYELTPWPDDGVEQMGPVIEYDERYVRLRGQRKTVRRVAIVLGVVAALLTPLVGFLPSRIKSALHGKIGVHPLTATQASITLERIASMLSGVLAMIHLSTGGLLTPELAPTLWLTPLLVVDAMMRTDNVIKEENPPPGFLEWLVPTRFRRSLAKERALIYRTR